MHGGAWQTYEPERQEADKEREALVERVGLAGKGW